MTVVPRLYRRQLLALAAAPTGLPLLLPLLAGGCAVNTDRDHNGKDAPTAIALPRQPRVAWVFSSGGPRGFVHVGVLKALDELGVAPDLLVGASVGSLVSVLRAAGMTGLQLERLALDFNPVTLARVARLFGGDGERLSGTAIAELVRDQLRALGHTPQLEKLPLMAVCVAHRIEPGSPGTVAFNCGDAGLAVQASAAIEGQFTPVRIRGQRHVDADLHVPLPVRLARALGAQRVLAVDASAHEEKAPPGSERYRSGDLRKRAATKPDAAAADLLLHPHFGYWVSLSQEFRQRAIDAGYRETLAQGVRIKALHAA